MLWTGGSEIPFFALPVELSQITDFSAPVGWRLWDPTSSDEGLNLQIDFQVGPPDRGLSPVIFFNPYQGLSGAFPGPATFAFTSRLRPGTIDVLYGGDEYVSVAGPTVPEPGTLVLMVAAIPAWLCGWLLRKRRGPRSDRTPASLTQTCYGAGRRTCCPKLP